MAVSEAYSGTDVGDNFYLSFILWSVAILAFFRAIGSGTFGLINAVEAVVEGRVRMRMKMPKWMGGWAGGLGERWRDGVSWAGSSVKS